MSKEVVAAIPITNGSFSDTFANVDAVHIYKVN